MVGGSSAPPATIRWFRKRGIRVRHLWGMTEMMPIGTVGAPPANWDSLCEDDQVDYLSRPGRSMFGVELRVVDSDRKVLPRDGASSGHLETRGLAVVQRYFKKDEDCVDEDNWFDTGDIAVIHPDNTLRLTDRAKDVIKSGGEWISSIELENPAVGCPGVAEAAAIGIAHPKWDERPLLLVVRDEEATSAPTKSSISCRKRSPNGGFPMRSSSSMSCPIRPPASSARRICATNIVITVSRMRRRWSGATDPACQRRLASIPPTARASVRRSGPQPYWGDKRGRAH